MSKLLCHTLNGFSDEKLLYVVFNVVSKYRNGKESVGHPLFRMASDLTTRDCWFLQLRCFMPLRIKRSALREVGHSGSSCWLPIWYGTPSPEPKVHCPEISETGTHIVLTPWDLSSQEPFLVCSVNHERIKWIKVQPGRPARLITTFPAEFDLYAEMPRRRLFTVQDCDSSQQHDSYCYSDLF